MKQYIEQRGNYALYRDIDTETGKGVWTARRVEMGTEVGEEIPITYRQARGLDPIDSEESMRMFLGKRLLKGV